MCFSSPEDRPPLLHPRLSSLMLPEPSTVLDSDRGLPSSSSFHHQHHSVSVSIMTETTERPPKLTSSSMMIPRQSSSHVRQSALWRFWYAFLGLSTPVHPEKDRRTQELEREASTCNSLYNCSRIALRMIKFLFSLALLTFLLVLFASGIFTRS